MTEQQGLPPQQDIDQLIRKEHYWAELLRHRAGLPGCGCSDCQSLYKKLDLSKYGKRVIEQDGIFTITEGKTGADLYDEYHKPDYWKGNIFFTGGKKYGVTPNGGTVVVGGVTETSQDTGHAGGEGREVVSKIPAKEIIPAENIQPQDNGIMKQRGRPRKTGEVSRVTAWRREKEIEKQGVLL